TAESHSEPHEAPWTMTAPLVVLAALSVVGGAISLPFARTAILEHFLHPVVEVAEQQLTLGGFGKVSLAVASTVIAAIGVFVGYRLWAHSADHPQAEPEFLERAWGIDDAISAT